MGDAANVSSSVGCTCDPPYKQLLVRLEASTGLIFHIEGGHYLSVTLHQGGVGWCLPDGCWSSVIGSSRDHVVSRESHML